MFLIEMHFCKPKVTHGLGLNLNFFFMTFLILKHLLKERSISLLAIVN